MWGAESGAGLTVTDETEKPPAVLLFTFKTGIVFIFSVLTVRKLSTCNIRYWESWVNTIQRVGFFSILPLRIQVYFLYAEDVLWMERCRRAISSCGISAFVIEKWPFLVFNHLVLNMTLLHHYTSVFI
jgi:hypothetical protein